MIKSQKNKVFESIFSLYLKRLLRKHFHSIRLSGGENYWEIDRSVPTIAYVNHSNWWDGFIAFYMARFVWKIDSYLMMDLEQLQKYKMFTRLGVFSVDRNSPQSAMESINYACELLRNTDRTLWIFPQGILLPNNTRPLKFYSGISALAEKLGKVNLLPVALKYEFMSEQRAEIFVQLGKVEIIESIATDKKDFTLCLQNNLTAELDDLNSKIAGNNMESFVTIFKGKESRNKTIDRLQ